MRDKALGKTFYIYRARGIVLRAKALGKRRGDCVEKKSNSQDVFIVRKGGGGGVER